VSNAAASTVMVVMVMLRVSLALLPPLLLRLNGFVPLVHPAPPSTP
jgi:hypothetical protein